MVRNANKLWHSPASPAGRRSFPVGSAVEVRSSSDGLQGVWFEAVLVKGLSKRRRYGVAYATLVAEEGSLDPLKESVYCSYVRPRPPPRDPSQPAFEVHQCVEAFHNEGWWRGVVSELPEEGGDGSYAVWFPTTWEEFRFEAEKLRRQMEWVRGKWVPFEDTQDVEHMMFGEGTRVEVSRDREHYGAAWFTGTVLKVIGMTYFFVEYDNLRVNSDNRTETLLKEIVDMQYIRPCPPSLVSTSFNVLDEVEGYHQDGWFVGIVSVILPGSRYLVKYKHQEERVVLDHISLRPCQVWTDGHWVYSSQKIVAKDKEEAKDRCLKGKRRGRGRPKKQSTEFSAERETETKITEDEKKESQGLNEHERPMKQSTDFSAARESKTKIIVDNEKESEGLSEHGRPMKQISDFSPAKENRIKITVENEKENPCSNKRGRGRPKKQRTVPFAKKKSKTAKEKESQGLDKARIGSGKPKKQTLTDSFPTTPKEETVVSQDQQRKRQTLRETKSAVPRQSSSATKRTSHPISQLTTSDDVADVAWESTLSNLKRRIADGPSQGLDESSLASKKSKKENLSEQHLQLLNDTSPDKRESLSIPAPNSRNNDTSPDKRESLSCSSEAMDLNGKDAVGVRLEGGVELSQACKKLKNGNMLEEHLLLDDETQSVIRKPRSNACKQIRLPIPVLTSSNDDGEVAAISGVLNSKDDVYQTSKKSEKGNSLEEHLQSVDGTLKECPSCSGEGTERQPNEVNFVHSPVVNKDADFVPTAYRRNGKGNPIRTVNTIMQRKKLVIRTPRRPVNTPNVVDMKHPVPEKAIPPKKIIFMNSMESKQLCENDKVLENTNSLLNISTEENSPGNDYASLTDKQVDMMEDAHAVPQIESSILNAKLLDYEVVHQLQALKSFLGSWSCTNRLAEAGAEAQHQALPSISSGLPSDNVVEMEKAQTVSAPTGSSPSEDVNVSDENEFSPSRLLAENAFVEAEDRALLDPSPIGSSISREGVADHSEVTACRSLSCRPVIEMEQVPSDPTPCRSSPSNTNSHDQEKLVECVMSSVMSCSFIDKCGEIQSYVDKCGENRRKRKNQALPAGFEKEVALDGDKLASTGPQIGQDIFKDGEMALLGPSSMELPYENIILPFTKRSEFWDSVQKKEVFRLLPQQPHFRPLLQYGKEFREGMAIGLMVTFTHLVTDLSSLRIADSHQEFEEKLKALGPLDANGFNIQPVRDRLEKLLELHSTLTQSEGEKQLLGVKVAELEDEKHQNDMLMFSVEKCMSVLEQNLTRLRERRASALLDIRKNDSELANLLRHVQAAEEASVSAERQFSTALTAPW